MKANDYQGPFREWANTMIEEETADGSLVGYTFGDGSYIEIDLDDKYGMPYMVTIGNTCNTFRTAQAAIWHLWDEWAVHNVIS